VVRQFADHLDPIPTRYRDLKISCGVGFGIYKNEQPNENTIGLISGSPNSDDTYLQMAYDLADVLMTTICAFCRSPASVAHETSATCAICAGSISA